MRSTRIAVPTWLAVAGLSLGGYPLLRPYGPEKGLAGAHDFASPAWLAAHVLGMVGFVSLALAARSAAGSSDPWPWSGRPIRVMETRLWLAVAFLLPYYGAEAYGLHELGRYAVHDGDPGVLDVADAFRYAPFEVSTFAAGLLLLGLVGVQLARGLWHSGGLGRAGGLLAGLGLVTYLPQFFGAPEARMTHGVVLAAGLVLLAVAARHQPSSGNAGLSDGSRPVARRTVSASSSAVGSGRP